MQKEDLKSQNLTTAMKKLESLNLLDDFLFWKMVSYPVKGEIFCHSILSVILDRDVGQVHVTPQRVYYGADPKKHGTRLDVYIEEDGCAEADPAGIFDIEPDQNNQRDQILALPKRVRFYHAMIDGSSLESGKDYDQLKHVAVIMIMPYDPFGLDRMVYTVRRICIEEPDMPYDDGAVTIFLYTKGTEGSPREELRQLLHYMENSREENAKGDLLQSIHQMVQTVKHSREVSLEYMKVFEREKMIRDEERKEEREFGIRTLIETCQEVNVSREEALRKVIDKYSLSSEQAMKYVKQYWQ